MIHNKVKMLVESLLLALSNARIVPEAGTAVKTAVVKNNFFHFSYDLSQVVLEGLKKAGGSIPPPTTAPWCMIASTPVSKTGRSGHEPDGATNS